jgi:hypothetical protein
MTILFDLDLGPKRRADPNLSKIDLLRESVNGDNCVTLISANCDVLLSSSNSGTFLHSPAFVNHVGGRLIRFVEFRIQDPPPVIRQIHERLDKALEAIIRIAVR